MTDDGTDTATKTCFVIMGFGKKTDYPSGRTLDLDKTYRTIIKPVAEDCGYKVVRADDPPAKGIIDTAMYTLLFGADLVIADISTGNQNAIYELGVRHALKPRHTIVMKEKNGQFLFDLQRIQTLQYVHMGEGIDFEETMATREALKEIIQSLGPNDPPDSPFYAANPDVTVDRQDKSEAAADREESDEADEADAEEGDEDLGFAFSTRSGGWKGVSRGAVEAAAKKVEREEDDLERLRAAVDDAVQRDAFTEAAGLLRRIKTMMPSDTYVTQQLALFTYKSRAPAPVEALEEARTILAELHPDGTVDPETLGIAGAIAKTLYLETGERAHLDDAIRYYGQGYKVRGDDYTGENYALCLDMRAPLRAEYRQAVYDLMEAEQVRTAILQSLPARVDGPGAEEQPDLRWIHATLANTARALGQDGTADRHEAVFRRLAEAPWEVQTFEKGKAHALKAKAWREAFYRDRGLA